jgi:hypothetical protein
MNHNELKAYLEEIAASIAKLDRDADDYNEKYQEAAKIYNNLNAIYRKEVAEQKNALRMQKARSAYQNGLEYVREIGDYLEGAFANAKAGVMYSTKYERDAYVRAAVGQSF